ncbi:MAG: hypothetical protein ABI120_18655 [Gemmatimonadaceae bacterium]
MTSFVPLGVSVGAVMMLSQAAIAQEVHVNGGRLMADHYLLGSALNGVGLGLTYMTRVRRLEFDLAVDRYAGSSNRVGVACGGFYNPDHCPTQPIRDRSTLYVLSVGPSLNIVRSQHLSVNLNGSVQGAGVSTTTIGLQNGGQLHARRALLGASVGLIVSWRTSAQSPFAFNGSASTGVLRNIRESGAIDGYEPYDGGSFRAHRLSVGVSYRLSNR